MALNLTQEDVQRSIFEAIRLVCVAEGYTPDIVTIGSNNQAGWDAALQTIKNTKGFVIELFGSSNNQAKGLKKVPRISIHPKRIIPGDVGMDAYQGYVKQDPNDPDKYIKFIPPFDLFNGYFDIHLVSDTGRQDVVLNAILFKAIGTRKFIPLITEPGQVFFILQQDYYETFDLLEGNTEKITSYQVPDLMLGNEEQISVAKIKEVDVEIDATGNPDEVDTLHVE